jgi:hypothetical protein
LFVFEIVLPPEFHVFFSPPEQVSEFTLNLHNVIRLYCLLHWQHGIQTEESQRGILGEAQTK